MFLRPAVWESTYPAFSLFQLGFRPCKSKSCWYIQKLFWMKAKQSSGRQGGGHRSRGESVLKLMKLKLQGLSLTWVPPWSWMQVTFICFAKYFRDALTAIIKTTSVHFNSPSIIKSSLSPTLTLSWAIFCLKNNYGKINLRIHLQCVEWDLWHPVISLSLWNGGVGKGFQERSHCLDSPSAGTRRYHLAVVQLHDCVPHCLPPAICGEWRRNEWENVRNQRLVCWKILLVIRCV